jgi:hypothetical protein
MRRDESQQTISVLTNDAAELAARAVGSGIARLIEAYVPQRLAGRFALRVVMVLIREVRTREVRVPVSVAPGTH